MGASAVLGVFMTQKNRNRYDNEYRINGEAPSITEWDKVMDGSRQPKVDVTPFVKLNLSWDELADRVARDLMYCEILWFFKRLLKTVDDVVLERMLYRFLHGRAVARKLKEGVEESPVAVSIDEKDIPDNPFETTFSKALPLHRIIEERESLLKIPERNLLEKLWLYRLRVDELLCLLNDSEAHLAWMEEDCEKLQNKLNALAIEKEAEQW